MTDIQGSPVWQALAGHKRRIPLAVASGTSQGRTGDSGAFGMWHHPRGSSRISS